MSVWSFRSRGLPLPVLLLVALGAACSSKQPDEKAPVVAYQAPPEGTPSLVETLTTSRDPQGKLLIVGRTRLPQGTRIVIDVYRGHPANPRRPVAETKLALITDGSFTADPLDVPDSGAHTIEITSYFNEIWQSPDVLALVGRNGTALPNSALKPDDPEFPDQGGSLRYVSRVRLDPLSPAIAEEYRSREQREKAIAAVKRSKLTVQGKGKAVDTVEQIVQYFDKPGLEFYPGAWSANRSEDGHWIVSLEHRWGNDQKLASWEYDPHSGHVRYLNPEAKMLSWIPAE